MKLKLLKSDGTIIEREISAGPLATMWMLLADILPMSDKVEVTVKGLPDGELARLENASTSWNHSGGWTRVKPE